MPKRSLAYAPWLASRLKEPRVAMDYLRASMGSPEEFLKALRKVAEAHQVSRVAEAAGRQRESVYRMLSEDGNPRLDSLWAVLQAVGLRITVDVAEGISASVSIQGSPATGPALDSAPPSQTNPFEEDLKPPERSQLERLVSSQHRQPEGGRRIYGS